MKTHGKPSLHVRTRTLILKIEQVKPGPQLSQIYFHSEKYPERKRRLLQVSHKGVWSWGNRHRPDDKGDRNSVTGKEQGRSGDFPELRTEWRVRNKSHPAQKTITTTRLLRTADICRCNLASLHLSTSWKRKSYFSSKFWGYGLGMGSPTVQVSRGGCGLMITWEVGNRCHGTLNFSMCITCLLPLKPDHPPSFLPLCHWHLPGSNRHTVGPYVSFPHRVLTINKDSGVGFFQGYHRLEVMGTAVFKGQHPRLTTRPLILKYGNG